MAISNDQIIFPDGESLATKLSSGGGAVAVSDNGTQITSSATELNFTDNIDVSDAGSGVVNISGLSDSDIVNIIDNDASHGSDAPHNYTTDHSTLDNLDWSDSGHSIDENLSVGGNFITNVYGVNGRSDIKLYLSSNYQDLELSAESGYNIDMANNVDMRTNKITNMAEPDNLSDAVNLGYLSNYISKDGGETIDGRLTVTDFLSLNSEETMWIADVFNDLYFRSPERLTFTAGGGNIDFVVDDGFVNLTSGREFRINTNNKIREDSSDNLEFISDKTLYFFINGGTNFDLMLDGSHIDVGENSLINLPEPTQSSHATRKSYVDNNFLKNPATTSLNMDNNKITNVATPTSNQDAANKEYVDNNAGGDVTNPLSADLEMGGYRIKDTDGNGVKFESSTGMFRFYKTS